MPGTRCPALSVSGVEHLGTGSMEPETRGTGGVSSGGAGAPSTPTTTQPVRDRRPRRASAVRPPGRMLKAGERDDRLEAVPPTCSRGRGPPSSRTPQLAPIPSRRPGLQHLRPDLKNRAPEAEAGGPRRRPPCAPAVRARQRRTGAAFPAAVRCRLRAPKRPAPVGTSPVMRSR